MKVLKKVKSTCKLGDYNSCPGEEYFQKRSPSKLEYIDITTDETFQAFINEEDTAVFKEPEANSSVSVADWMQFVSDVHPDEFEVIDVNGEKAIRMWWD